MNLNWMLEEYDGIVYVSDMKTYEIRYLNKAGCLMCNVTKDDIEHKKLKCYEVLQGVDAPCTFCTNGYLKDSDFYEWEYRNPHLKRTFLLKDRKYIWGGREARIEFATDISAYRDKITSKERERDSVLKCLPGGIVRIDARDARTVLWYGANFLPMIGYTKEQFEEELKGQCIYIHPDDIGKIMDIMTTLKETGKILITEMKIITRDGDVRTLTATFSYEDGDTNEDGIPSYYSVGIDITEIKEQQALQQKALEDAYYVARIANQAKTDFLSRMSHDIRTPMNAILGMAAIAEAHINEPLRVADCLKKINSSGKHLLDLINEVLDMSKIENGRLELADDNFDMGDLVQSVFDLCRPLLLEMQHQVKLDISNVVHDKVIGDVKRLEQVFVNILSNAIKYTETGGEIKFKIEESPTHVENTSLFKFIFEDNGIGMTEDFVKRIFEPFLRAEDSRTNQIQGTGLGMAISENIINMMSGSILVDSKVGEGSTFTVSVPLQLQNTADQSIPELNGLPVLVVDDERDTCENTCLILNEIGMCGKWVLSGEEAVQEVSRAHQIAEDFFAIILDWKMPGMGGLETAKAIRKQVGPDAPIIIASAYDYSDVEEELVLAGVDAFITKPLFKSKMIQIFRRFAHGKYEEAKRNKVPSEKTALRGRRLLLVEDNEINREIAEEILKEAGILVDTACNGKEAVEIFSRSQSDYYDMILMDVQMPVMNGLEASKAIRALDRKDAKTIAILALTANAFSEDVIQTRKAGMNEHITKPIDSEKMFSLIEKWLPHQSAVKS